MTYAQAKAEKFPDTRLGEYLKNRSSIDTETALNTLIVLEACRKGCRLWRNNRGAVYAPNGSFIRYGLANESEHLNKVLKSSDLIGIKPIKIEKHHVGKTIGQFLSRETKKPGWKFNKASPLEVAQRNWIELIISLGGDAAFATDDQSI